MSYTEIYAFGKDGNAYYYGDTKNAFRGAMAVWGVMECRHLPQYIPEYAKHMNAYRDGMTEEEVVKILGYRPSRTSAMTIGKENPMQEIWELAGNRAIPRKERIVLLTTLDYVLVKREHIPEVIDAFRTFGGDTSLPEQAAVLEEMLGDEDIIAVGWNQTSVCADTWENYGGWDDETDEPIPYNCLTGTKHYWLFEELDCKDVGGIKP